MERKEDICVEEPLKGDGSALPAQLQTLLGQFREAREESTEVSDFLADAEEHLSGSKKEEYFQTVSGLKFNISKMVLLMKRNIDMFRKLAISDRAEYFRLICTGRPDCLPVLLSLVHWIYFIQHFPWSKELLTSGEQEELDKITKTFRSVMADQIGIADRYTKMMSTADSFMKNFNDDTGRTTLVEECTRGVMKTIGVEGERIYEKILIESAFTDEGFESICSLFHIDSGELTDMKGRHVLDVGPGGSPFATTLREKGVKAFQLDQLGVPELRRKFPKGKHWNSISPFHKTLNFLS